MSRYFKDKSKKIFHKKQTTEQKFNRFYSGKNNDEEEDDPFPGDAPVPENKVKKYRRGKSLQVAGIRTIQGVKKYKNLNKAYSSAAEHSARAELLLPEESGYLEPDEDEETYNITQDEIVSTVDITSATKHFDLNLEFGPYCLNYSRNGRYLLLGGKMGHLAAFDWVTKKLLCETNVMETIHAVQWLHMPTMYAVAQKDWVYVYDTEGTELHCIKKLFRVSAMEFLPYHFLLANAHETGYLSWLDISIGKMVAQFHAKQGALKILCQNPYNATLLTGHSTGTVSMWTPNVQEPVLKMLCHFHPLRAIAVDSKGSYLATSSVDRSLKIWDLRTYKCLQSYKLGGTANVLDFSQTGLLSVGMKNMVEVYKGCCTKTVDGPYMRHTANALLRSVHFCPFEDVLGLGHCKGFTSILIPGAGEPNFDAYEMNPFMTKSQRKEMEVKMLLEKIQPEMITLDPLQLGHVDVEGLKAQLEERKKVAYVKLPKIEFEPKKKKRTKTAKTFKRKKGVIEEKKQKLVAEVLKKKNMIKKKAKSNEKTDVLDRFKPKS